jgi:DNA-binding MarR family transcriptional regulator
MSSVLSALTVPEIVKLYNLFAVKNGTSTVKKFTDRTTAELKLQDISRGVKRADVLAIFKTANIKKNVTALLPEKPSAALPEQPPPKTSKPPASKQTTPPAKNAKLVEAEEREKQRWEKENQKQEKELRKERRNLSPQAAIILECIKRMIKPDAAGEAAQVTTTDIATTLKTSTTVVCKSVEQLDRLGLVSFEDDSPDDTTKFYYVSLTAGGRGLDSAAATKKQPDAAAPAKAPKLPSDAPGPRSKLDGKKLYRIAKTNPRREGTWGYKSFELIKDGMTFEAYKAAGGRNNDLAWDIAHGFVEVRD